MVKVKITVLKTGFDEELAKEYGVEGIGPAITKRGRNLSATGIGSRRGCAAKRGNVSSIMRMPFIMVRILLLGKAGCGNRE